MSSENDDLFQRATQHGIDSLAPHERDYIAIWELHAETSNGSLDQYFANSSGDHALEALAALRNIGATTTVGIFERSLALFGPGGYTADTDLRNQRLNALPDEERFPAFTSLTDEFYDSVDELNERLDVYMKQHAAKPKA